MDTVPAKLTKKLVMEIEERHKISVPEEGFEDIKTVGQATEFMRKILGLPPEDGEDDDGGSKVREPRNKPPTPGFNAATVEEPNTV